MCLTMDDPKKTLKTILTLPADPTQRKIFKQTKDDWFGRQRQKDMEAYQKATARNQALGYEYASRGQQPTSPRNGGQRSILGGGI